MRFREMMGLGKIFKYTNCHQIWLVRSQKSGLAVLVRHLMFRKINISHFFTVHSQKLEIAEKVSVFAKLPTSWENSQLVW